MRASKVIGGIFALGLVGAAVASLSYGLDRGASIQNPFCRNIHLSMKDQDSCATEMKAAANDEQRQDVINRYQVKINTAVAMENPDTAAAASAATVKI